MLKAPKFWYQKSISLNALLLSPLSIIWSVGNLIKRKLSKVQKIDLENNFILIKGAVPGPNGSEVTIKPATKKT